MMSTLTSKGLLAATTGLAVLCGCSGKEQFSYPNTQPAPGSSGTAAGGGSAGNDPGSSGGAAGSGGSGGFWQAEPGSNPGAAGADAELTKVWKSAGCDKTYEGPRGNTKITIGTRGEKDAVCSDKLQDGTARCGAWGQASSEWLATPLPRDYYLYLPQGYDASKAYPLVFQGPGCGGDGTQVVPLNDGTAPNVGNSVIRVGITPASTSIIGHGCCPYGCFDDREGDDSVDWVLYENLYDKLNDELCFDRNRVFASGNRSGATFANELACKYAGDSMRPVRAALPNSGYWPTSAAELPTCTQAPVAGMWVHDSNDPETPFLESVVAIDRAMKASGCDAADYASTAKENFPIGGGQAPDVCKRITGCNPLYPLVVCALAGAGKGSHDDVVNPGFSTFVKLFSTGALLTE